MLASGSHPYFHGGYFDYRGALLQCYELNITDKKSVINFSLLDNKRCAPCIYKVSVNKMSSLSRVESKLCAKSSVWLLSEFLQIMDL